jgi:hypothetical protein
MANVSVLLSHKAKDGAQKKLQQALSSVFPNPEIFLSEEIPMPLMSCSRWAQL